MSFTRALARFQLCGILAATCWAQAAGDREVRYLQFIAKSKHGFYLRDVERQEVRLWIDDRPVSVDYLGYKDVETEFLFLIENSHRTAQYNVSMPQFGQINVVDQIRQSLVNGFFLPLVELGPVLLAEFGFEARILEDFTRFDDQLDYALRKMSPQPSFTELRDIPVGKHLLWGVDTLRKRDAKRKILVLFTTIVDRESLHNLEEYKSVLTLFDVELYVVSFAPRISSGTGKSHEQKVNHTYFRKLCEQTAGKLYLTGEYLYLDEFMDDLLVRLSNSYTIGFYVNPGEHPQERSIKLEVRDRKVKVDHRKSIAY